MSYKYKGMKKTSATRYLELLHGLFIVKDCLKLISEGRDYHIITISGQLRGYSWIQIKRNVKHYFLK